MLQASEVKELCLQKGVVNFYHANAVLTSLTFLREGGLLSRGSVEQRGLLQESQMSDDSDKAVGVWNEVFLDTVDIHKRSSNANTYGPVLFVLSSHCLDYEGIKSVQVTKANPQEWLSIDVNKRSFNDICELEKELYPGNFGQEIMIEIESNDVLPFSRYLEKVILDDPQIEDQSYFRNARKILFEEVKKSFPQVEFEIRKCEKNSCQCMETYGAKTMPRIWHQYCTSH